MGDYSEKGLADCEEMLPSSESIDAIPPGKKAIKRVLRPLVRRTFSPGTVQRIRYWWWCVSSYLPRVVASRFVKRTAQVRGFGGSLSSSHVAWLLRNRNVIAPTQVCRVMTKYGSDKGRSNNYTPLYSTLFGERGGQPLRLLELGLGTNDPDVPSNMGVFGVPGASLRAWRELFPKALVYGADIDRRILLQEDRIRTFYCDQLDALSIRDLWSQPELKYGADIIIEDGLHTFEASVSFLEGSLGQLGPGGTYITEDIAWYDLEKWGDQIEMVYSKRYPEYEFALVVQVEHGHNNLLVVRRGAESAGVRENSGNRSPNSSVSSMERSA